MLQLFLNKNFLKKKALTIIIGLFCLQLTTHNILKAIYYTNFIQGFLESENYFKVPYGLKKEEREREKG